MMTSEARRSAPLLTVITVSFNSASTIADTLRSVKAQTFEDYEHVVIDGASKDGTQDLIEQHATSRTRWQSEPDSGLYHAMNKGLATARGEFVCFLNADDYFNAPTVLAQIAGVLESSSPDVVYGDIVYVAQHATSKVTRRWFSGRYTRRKTLLGWHPPHPAFVARNSVLQRAGGFPLDLRIAADYELMLRVLLDRRVTVAYLPEVFVQMRQGGSSTRGISSYIEGNLQSYLALRRIGVPFPALAVALKPLRKLPQFVRALDFAR